MRARSRSCATYARCTTLTETDAGTGEVLSWTGNRIKKGNSGFKRTGRAFLGEEQAEDPQWWSQEDFAWWSKGKRGKKGFSKGNEGFQKGGFRSYQPEKGASNDFNPHKGREKDQKGKGKEGAYPQSGLSVSETPSEKDMAMPGNQTTGLAAICLTSPQAQLLGGLARELIQHGWRQSLGTLLTIELM